MSKDVKAGAMSSARERLATMLREKRLFDLRQYKAELWLLSAAEYEELENILASSKAIIFNTELSCSFLTLEA